MPRAQIFTHITPGRRPSVQANLIRCGAIAALSAGRYGHRPDGVAPIPFVSVELKPSRRSRVAPQAPASRLRFLLSCRDLVSPLGWVVVLDVRMRRSGASRFDRIVPAIGLIQVGQSSAVLVGHVLRRDERGSLSQHGRLGEVRRLRSPAADGESGLLRFRCVDPQEPQRRRPRLSWRMSMVSPSTTFSTSAVVTMGSAFCRSGSAGWWSWNHNSGRR